MSFREGSHSSSEVTSRNLFFPDVSGDGVTNDSALVTLVSLLGEKDTSLSSLHKEVAFLRNELDQAKVQLQREADERARDKENAESFRNTVHAHLRKNISMVNR